MLELQNIVKTYPVGDSVVKALKGVSLTFREHEFVSILGPSGCGKTTLLNIIGGLDKYTFGNLIINGKSTRDFRDRDWDTYRNHSVGFVFQSYNLIPHQTVLKNVELALTLSGVSKTERRKRAVEALEQVGLGDQLRKKPAEMSGGQMQRVAIARAIVNKPDIILADEPTGALDTETSVQVMEILKKISTDCLIVMVTHNPDLAAKYSSRIINILDGKITGDSAPLSDDELKAEREKCQAKNEADAGKKKPSMSLFTSFGLSLNNLITKKGRTALTSFAGSIGIIGIALIYAVSNGMTIYIDSVQEETLSSYPLTLAAQEMDLSTLIETFMGKASASKTHDNDAIYQKFVIYEMMNALNTTEAKKNDLRSFKAYLERERADENSPLHDAVSGVQYSYDTNLIVYTKNIEGEIMPADSQKLFGDVMKNYMNMDMSAMMSMGGVGGAGGQTSQYVLWQEMLPGNDGRLYSDLIENQYRLVYGRFPNDANEILLVVDSHNELDDMTLYAMGLKSSDEIKKVTEAVMNRRELDTTETKWSYEEVCGRDYRVILPSDCYSYDASTGVYTDLRSTPTGLQYLYDNGYTLKIVGIIKPKEGSNARMLNGSLVYTSKLTEYLIDHSEESDAVKAQKKTPTVDIFTGLPFADNASLTEAEKAASFREYLSKLDKDGKADTYVKIMSIPSEATVNASVTQAMANVTRESIEQMMLPAMVSQTGMNEATLRDYLTGMSDEEIFAMYRKSVTEQVEKQYAAGVAAQLAAMTGEQLSAALDMASKTYTDSMCAVYYDSVLTFSDSTYEENLTALGCVSLDSPSSISIYASSFADKDAIKDAIASYNETVDDLSEISYTDYVGIIMSSVTTIINAITYVLIAFVAVSLVVSSIMIGVITLISVQERTKEIGILRAIGASKKNVSGMFNAETVMIGFFSGVVGVGITYALSVPINMILHKLTGIETLSVYLPPVVALILVGVSVLLTLIAGIIPSGSAAKKDPVVALRSE